MEDSIPRHIKPLAPGSHTVIMPLALPHFPLYAYFTPAVCYFLKKNCWPCREPPVSKRSSGKTTLVNWAELD
jgi:hypothetical protein